MKVAKNKTQENQIKRKENDVKEKHVYKCKK